MKICITATGNSLEAQAESSFGRAPWLIVAETDTNAVVEPIENSGVNVSQGAGIAVAQIIADKGVQALLTGRVGPKAKAALQAAGISIFENIARGSSVREALDQFNRGQCRMSTGPVTSPGAGFGQGKGLGRGVGGRGRGMGQGRRGGM